ncbi:MAG: flagellar basal body P-ring formation chaperone FlgA [Planctomycetota bacterium]
MSRSRQTGIKSPQGPKAPVVGAVIMAAFFCQESGYGGTDQTHEGPALQVYLPREVMVRDDSVLLGQIGIIRGNGQLADRAGTIALGRISLPGQKVVIDRSVVLSRLACSGIGASSVKLTGAEKVTVTRHPEVIESETFVDRASSFLKGSLPVGAVRQVKPVRVPKDLVVPQAGAEFELCPRLVVSGARNRARVQVTVSAGGKRLGMREVIFQLQYNCRRAVALVDIAAGSAITAENTRIETAPSNYPEPANWQPPYGLIAKRPLGANTEIKPHMIGPAKPPLLFKRHQTVVVRIERPGFLVTVLAKALQPGHEGEFVKVQNVDSKRTILARVNKDGTVEPVL